MSPAEEEIKPVLDSASSKARRFLKAIGSRRAATPPGEFAPSILGDGIGSIAAIDEFWSRFSGSLSGNTGPRYWGFVNGGVTPAALAGDWLCAAIDQNCQLNGDGAAVHIEEQALNMLRDLLRLPPEFHGVFVTGGTMANFTALWVAVQRLGRRRGVDVSVNGIGALGPIAILSGEPHSSIEKSASMMGLGRDAVHRIPLLAGREAVDPAAMAERLRALSPTHSIILVGNAGTVLTGDFDDLETLADLAAGHGAHFHVDGAFGAFASCSTIYRRLVNGMARADTVASDAHKFLNVPIDSGFVFSRSLSDQIDVFKNVSTYQAPPTSDPRHYIHLSLQNTRRFRGLPAWLTLKAYGRDGYCGIVEQSGVLASDLGRRIELDPHFRLLTPVRFNVVCFQLLVEGRAADEEETGAFIRRVAADGRVFVSPGRLGGVPCVRLAIVNWRTCADDIRIAMEAFRDCRAEPQT